MDDGNNADIDNDDDSYDNDMSSDDEFGDATYIADTQRGRIPSVSSSAGSAVGGHNRAKSLSVGSTSSTSSSSTISSISRQVSRSLTLSSASTSIWRGRRSSTNHRPSGSFSAGGLPIKANNNSNSNGGMSSNGSNGNHQRSRAVGGHTMRNRRRMPSRYLQSNGVIPLSKEFPIMTPNENVTTLTSAVNAAGTNINDNDHNATSDAIIDDDKPLGNSIYL
jgi:hypothetical protein